MSTAAKVEYRLVLIPVLAIALAASAFLTVVWTGTTPAGAQDGYQPDEQLIDDVRGYARETEKGHDHVLRWMRVLHTFDALDDVTAAEAQDYADNGWQRWVPVADALADLENAPGDYQPDGQLISDVRGYAQETESGYAHVLRWMRVLHTFDVLEHMTAAEAQRYADNGWQRWDPVAAELAQLEASTADPEPTPTATPQPTPTATPDPNLAPVVNTQAKHYADFIGRNNAPRGLLVSKPFHGIFSDPDGDKLTYSVSVPADQLRLVDEVLIPTEEQMAQSGHPIEVIQRVFFRGEAEADWKALTPPVPDRPVVTATLTATDPGGRSASVQGDFLVWWDSYPEVVSAVASGSAMELTFDWAVEDDPAPKAGQFTVNVVNEDGSSRTVAVSGVSVSGKVVRLELASALADGQTVTVDYAYDYPDDVPLQRDGGGDAAPGFSGQPVEIPSLEPPGGPETFAVSVELGELDLWARWDEVEGATSYKLAWRQADGEFEAANATTVTDTSATITMSAYGEWEVRLQACNDAGCVPGASELADEAPTVRLSLAPAPDAASQSQVRANTFTTTSDLVEDATSYTVGWRRARAESQGPVLPATRVPSGAVGQEANAQREKVNRAADETDTTPPRLERGEIDGDTMTFYFSEALDENAVGAQFRVILDWGSRWCSFTAHPRKVEVSGSQVVVHGLTNRGWPGWYRVGVGDRVRAYYYKDDRAFPADERLRDLAGNEVSTPNRSPCWCFPSTRTIDLVNLTAPPALEGATAHPGWLTLTFDERLDGNSVPAGSAFTVTVNGSAVSLADVDPVVVSGETVTLVLASTLASTDVVTVSYTKPSGSPLRGVDGAVESFSTRSVTNLVGEESSVSQAAITSTPADGEAYAAGETIQVSLTFTEAVNVDTTGGTPRLKIKLAPDNGEKWADYASGSGTTTLAFDYTVVEPDRSTRGVAVLRDALELNGGAIRSTAAQKDAHLWYPGLGHDPDHMVDWHGSAPGVPWVTGVAISSDPGDDDTYALGDTIEVTATFSEAVTVDTTNGTPRLKIKMDPGYGEKWANYASGSGTNTLVFAYTVVDPNRSTQGVAVLGNTLELNGGTIRSTATTPVNAHLRYEGLDHDPNHKVNGTTPTLRSASVDGTRLVLTYDEALDEDSAPAASAFTVKVNESPVSLADADPVAVRGVAVILTLAAAVGAGDTVTVSYAKPAGAADPKLRDAAGNEAASFTNQAAGPDTTQPRLVRGEIDGVVLTQFYNEALDEITVPPANAFRVNLAWTLGFVTPTKVQVSGNTAVLTLPHRAKVGQIVNTRYLHPADPQEPRLRDLAGNEVATSQRSYMNGQWRDSTRIITPDNLTSPSLERAAVNRDRLTLTFDTSYMVFGNTFSSPLESDSVPAALVFTVKVNGSEVSLANANPVAVAGSAVNLTLAAEVNAGDTVTVSYARPATNPLRNAVGEIANFADMSATNSTS